MQGSGFSFRYRIVSLRDLDGDYLIESPGVGDNVIAILTRLRDRKKAVQRIISKIAGLGEAEREVAFAQLLLLAGLRRLEQTVEQEARKVPILNDIMDHKVLGREFKRGLQEGELTLLRRQIEKRFGAMPAWAEERLNSQSPAQLEDLGVRLLDAGSIEDLLK